MSKKTIEKLLNENIDDKYILEASDAEAFFAERRIAIIKRKRLMRMIPIIAASLAIMVALVIAAGSLFPKDGDGQKSDGTDGPSNSYNGDDDPFYDDWDDDTWGEEGPSNDPNNGSSNDNYGNEEESEDVFDILWSKIKNLTVPNSKVRVSGIYATAISGYVSYANAHTVISGDNAFACINNFALATDRSDTQIRIEYTQTGESAGLAFGASKEKSSTSWKIKNTKCYIILIERNGILRLVESVPTKNGTQRTDVVEPVIIATYPDNNIDNTVKVVIEFDGKSSIRINANGTILEASNIDPKMGTEFGIVNDEGLAAFKDFVFEADGYALDIQTRRGEQWTTVSDSEYHSGGVWNGYEGSSAKSQKNLAIILNATANGASKVTFSVDMANGADWRKENYSVDQRYGIIVNVYNNDAVMPIFWQTESGKPSYFQIYMNGHDSMVYHGKWGIVSEDYAHLGDGWVEIDSLYNEDFVKSDFEYGKYNNLKVIYDIKEGTLTSYVDGQKCKESAAGADILKESGNWVGIISASGDVYFNNFVLTIE